MKNNYEEILEEITKKVTRDNGTYFTDTTRLDYIKTKLEKSDYDIYGETDLSVIYKKKNVDLPTHIVLISSHVDCVDGIQNPDFKITKKGNYKGTFDNAATNAAVVIAMLEQRFADNVLIAFTGDEEEDSNGAKQVIEYLERENKKVIAIALDVTLDLESEQKNDNKTTYKYAAYTIDNLCSNTSKKIAKKLFKTANELGSPFMVTRANEGKDYFDDIENDISDYYKECIEVEGVAYDDEAIEYFENKCCIGAFSLCLPTNAESIEIMHSDDLIKIKKKSFVEYIEAVVRISSKMVK